MYSSRASRLEYVRTMLPLHCCPHVCPDVREENNLFFLHSGTWDCEKRETDAKEFYGRFRHLPPEMKLHVLSFCQFHVLANTELWLKEEAPHFLSRLLERDPHFSTHRCESCSQNTDRRPTFFLAKDQFPTKVCLYVSPSPEPSYAYTSSLGAREEEAFGRNNRFTCCYYRRCRHHDMSRPSHEETCESERWRLLARLTGAKLSATEESFLHTLKPLSTLFRGGGSQWVFSTDFDYFKSWIMPDSLSETLRKELNVSMAPGTYYFEFVDHTWESMVAAVDGRTRHFFVDPFDTMPGTGDRHRGRIFMSLDFRRILHPTEDACETFEIVRRFDQSDDERERSVVIENVRKVLMIPVCGENEDCGKEEGNMQKLESQMVYKHALSPMTCFSVYRWAVESKDSCPKTYGFRVALEDNVRLFSIEKKKGCFRINFFVDVRDMSIDDRARYGDALRRLAQGSDSSFYAFMFTRTVDVDGEDDANKVFETFIE